MDTIENEVLAELAFDAGYFNSDNLSYPNGALAPGSQNVFLTDNRSQRTFRGLLASGVGGRTLFNVAGGHASLNDSGATQGKGSVFNFINESLFAVGAGDLYYNGNSLGVPVTSALQLAAKVGTYNYPTWFTAGLAQPNAPQVVAKSPGTGFTGRYTGLISYKIARVRGLTGARSIASPTSAAVVFAGQTARLTFSALASNGQDRWAIFRTKTGFGGTGVHYLIKEIADTDLSTIDGVARSYEIEEDDGDLLPVTAYIDDYPPQAALFAARLENYVLAIGCYENAIAFSVRNFPESFPPEWLAFLPKRPTAVLADPQGSYLYVSTDSSVHAVSVIPQSGNPAVIQTIWSSIGVANSHNWCSIEGIVFAFTSKAGAVTMSPLGQPTQEFALPVSKAMREWLPADTVVFPAPHLNSVIYANGGDAYAYNLQTGIWSSPAKLSDVATGSIVSAAVVDRKPYVSLLNGSTFTLYEFDNGTQPITAKIVSPPIVPMQGYRVNILGVRSEFYAPHAGTYVTDCMKDYDTTVVKSLSHFTILDGMQSTIRSRWYIPRCESYQVEWSGTQSDFTRDMYVARIIVFGTAELSTPLTRSVTLALTVDGVPLVVSAAPVTYSG